MTKGPKRTQASQHSHTAAGDPGRVFEQAAARLARLHPATPTKGQAEVTSSGGLGAARQRELSDQLLETGRTALTRPGEEEEPQQAPRAAVGANVPEQIGALERHLLYKGIGAVGFLIMVLLGVYTVLRSDITTIRAELRESIREAKDDLRLSIGQVQDGTRDHEQRLRALEAPGNPRVRK